MRFRQIETASAGTVDRTGRGVTEDLQLLEEGEVVTGARHRHCRWLSLNGVEELLGRLCLLLGFTCS